MNVQNIYNLFQISPDLFSLLLQTDVAILGFVVVAAIYKLQSLNTLKQSIIQNYYTVYKSGKYINNINSLLFPKTPQETADILLHEKIKNRYNFMHYSFIVLIPANEIKVRKQLQYFALFLGLHIIRCALYFCDCQNFIQYVCLQNVLLLLTLPWFVGGIIWALYIFIFVCFDNVNNWGSVDSIEQHIKELLPEVYKLMN